MKKLVYISSLGHSGSTLLNLLLGENSKVVALGKVNSSISNYEEEQHVCTCNSEVDNCIVWGCILSKLNNSSYKSSIQIYNDLFNALSSGYNVEKIMCDSSKQISWFYEINSKDFNSKVIFLVKDVRSYAHFQVRKKK